MKSVIIRNNEGELLIKVSKKKNGHYEASVDNSFIFQDIQIVVVDDDNSRTRLR